MAGQSYPVEILLNARDQASAVFGKVAASASEASTVLGLNAQQWDKTANASLVAGGAILGGLGAIAQKTATYGDELAKASGRTGVAVESLGRLRYAAERSDVQFGSLVGALQKMSRSADEAAQGTAQQAEAFARLGVSVTDSTGQLKDSELLFTELAGAISGIPNETERTALAMAVFGRSGAQLLPLLNEGSAGIQALGDRAQQLGFVMSGPAAANAELFNDMLDDAKDSLFGVALQIGPVLLPQLAELANNFAMGVSHVAAFMQQNEWLVWSVMRLGVGLVAVGGAIKAVQFATAAYNATITVTSALKQAWTLATGAAAAASLGDAAAKGVQAAATDMATIAATANAAAMTGTAAAAGGAAAASVTAGVTMVAAMLPVIAVLAAVLAAILSVRRTWEEWEKFKDAKVQLEESLAGEAELEAMREFQLAYKAKHGSTEGWRAAWESTSAARTLRSASEAASARRRERLGSRGGESDMDSIMAQAQAAMKQSEELQKSLPAMTTSQASTAQAIADALPSAVSGMGATISLPPGTQLDCGGQVLTSIMHSAQTVAEVVSRGGGGIAASGGGIAASGGGSVSQRAGGGPSGYATESDIQREYQTLLEMGDYAHLSATELRAAAEYNAETVAQFEWIKAQGINESTAWESAIHNAGVLQAEGQFGSVPVSSQTPSQYQQQEGRLSIGLDWGLVATQMAEKTATANWQIAVAPAY